MNLLLFLTALLTSLTGMISGDRAAVSRVQASAVAAGQAGEIAQPAPATITQTSRPIAQLPSLRRINLALPVGFALTPSGRLTPEKRRE